MVPAAVKLIVWRIAGMSAVPAADGGSLLSRGDGEGGGGDGDGDGGGGGKGFGGGGGGNTGGYGGGSRRSRGPQSVQSVPNSHIAPKAPQPPSWQTLSPAVPQVFRQTAGGGDHGGGEGGGGAGEGGGGDGDGGGDRGGSEGCGEGGGALT